MDLKVPIKSIRFQEMLSVYQSITEKTHKKMKFFAVFLMLAAIIACSKFRGVVLKVFLSIFPQISVMGASAEGVGHETHGNGNGYGHENHDHDDAPNGKGHYVHGNGKGLGLAKHGD
jgi:hypothetical protein